MDSIRTEDFSLQNTCVTIGKFDGVHLGHRLLLEKIPISGSAVAYKSWKKFTIRNRKQGEKVWFLPLISIRGCSLAGMKS